MLILAGVPDGGACNSTQRISGGMCFMQGILRALFPEELTERFECGAHDHPAVFALAEVPSHLLSSIHVNRSVQVFRQLFPDLPATQKG
jgi:hypothetical protein